MIREFEISFIIRQGTSEYQRNLLDFERTSEKPIKAFIRHDNAILLINWIEEADLTVYPPTISPLPHTYIKSTKAYNCLIHCSSHHQSHVYSTLHASEGITHKAIYLYRNGRHSILWTIVAPPGTESYALAKASYDEHVN